MCIASPAQQESLLQQFVWKQKLHVNPMKQDAMYDATQQ
jgi:hypothetical protein